MQVQVIVSGTGDWRYVDCVSAQGGKLQALEYVRTAFSIPRAQCLSAGDSGNDILMLKGAVVVLCPCLFGGLPKLVNSGEHDPPPG